jgi:hypothetical protein
MSPISLSHTRASDNPPLDTRRAEDPIAFHLGSTGRYRETLSPPGTNRVAIRPHPQSRWRPHLTRTTTLMMGLVVLVGGLLTMSTAAAPAASAATPTTPRAPLPTADPCAPDLSLTVCPPAVPATTSPMDNPAIPGSCLPGSSPTGCQNPASIATSSSLPCPGQGCLPQAATSIPGVAGLGTGQPSEGDTGEVGCGVTASVVASPTQSPPFSGVWSRLR